MRSRALIKQRFEPLYNTVLILLASDPNAATGETVRQRLDDLGALVASGDHDHELEIRALAALVGAAGALEALKEEEIHKREEVIRDVTERVLGKDRTDS